MPQAPSVTHPEDVIWLTAADEIVGKEYDRLRTAQNRTFRDFLTLCTAGMVQVVGPIALSVNNVISGTSLLRYLPALENAEGAAKLDVLREFAAADPATCFTVAALSVTIPLTIAAITKNLWTAAVRGTDRYFRTITHLQHLNMRLKDKPPGVNSDYVFDEYEKAGARYPKRLDQKIYDRFEPMIIAERARIRIQNRNKARPRRDV